MDGIYREYSIGIDIITSDQALELVNPTVVKVLREMWSDNEGICIAGGDVHTTFTIYFFTNSIIHRFCEFLLRVD